MSPLICESISLFDFTTDVVVVVGDDDDDDVDLRMTIGIT